MQHPTKSITPDERTIILPDASVPTGTTTRPPTVRSDGSRRWRAVLPMAAGVLLVAVIILLALDGGGADTGGVLTTADDVANVQLEKARIRSQPNEGGAPVGDGAATTTGQQVADVQAEKAQMRSAATDDSADGVPSPVTAKQRDLS